MTEIDAIPAGEATAEVARQREAWGGAIRSVARVEPSRLRLVTPEEASSAPVARPKGTADSASGTSGAPATGDDKRVALGSQSLSAIQRNSEERPRPPPRQVIEEPAAVPQAAAPERAVEEQPQPSGEPAPLPTSAASSPSLLDRLADFWVEVECVVIGLLKCLVRLGAQELAQGRV